MSKPYSIFLPNFDTTSGGIRVLWGLFGALLAKGQIIQPNVTWNKPFIGIYPEIVSGNPLNAQTVVRYILAPLGEMALINKDPTAGAVATPGPTSYPDTDLIYSFSKLIYEADDEHTLFLPIIDTHLFKDQHKVRNKKAVLYGKRPNLNLHPADCIEVDRRFASDQGALADLLNECQMLYVYDHRTAMTECARLCACPVTIIPSSYTKEEFEKYEPGLNGVNFGMWENNKLDAEAFREHYLELGKIFQKKLDLFIDATQHA